VIREGGERKVMRPLGLHKTLYREIKRTGFNPTTTLVLETRKGYEKVVP
jgi:hypothetical protein